MLPHEMSSGNYWHTSANVIIILKQKINENMKFYFIALSVMCKIFSMLFPITGSGVRLTVQWSFNAVN